LPEKSAALAVRQSALDSSAYNRVLDVACELKPPARSEMEITGVNVTFLEWSAISVEELAI